jgi:hypothetical protein
MTFVTQAAQHPAFATSIEPPSESKRLEDAAHKLTFIPEYKLLLEHLRGQAIELLNRSLADVSPRSVHTRGRLHAYREIYRTLTNGKELFDAAP